MTKLQLTSIQAKAILAAKEKFASVTELFRPTEQQEEVIRTFEKDDILELLLGGGNRAGKSLTAAMMLRSLILNEPIIFRDGSKHYMRPERWRNEPLKIWIVGFDWDHIGKTLHRLLFKKGAFRVFRDDTTGKWRAWDPDNPAEPKSKTRFAPALIRPTDIIDGEDGMSWENKKESQVSSFNAVHDETRVEFFPSTGAIPQGDPANVIWIDEKVNDEKWLAELRMRLIDFEGRMLWTAWPDTAPSDEMSALEDRAKDQAGKPEQFSYHITLRGSDNPYTKSKHRDRIMSTLDEDQRAARDEGVMNKDRWRIYPRFSKYIHRVYGPDPAKDDALAKIVRATGGIPANWTRYLILDPGTAHPAVLFVTVPPPIFGNYVVPYDELYLPYTSAKPLAQACAAKAGITAESSGDVFEEFIADFHALRQTPMGFDGTIGENYEKEFAAVKLGSRRRGSRFTPGSDNVIVRIMRVQGMLNADTKGFPRLRILGCPHLVRQLENSRWGKNPKGDPTDKPADHQKIDVVQCLEYFGSRDDCGYFEPPPVKTLSNRSMASVKKTITNLLGMTNPKQDKVRSVTCGAGEPSSLFV